MEPPMLLPLLLLLAQAQPTNDVRIHTHGHATYDCSVDESFCDISKHGAGHNMEQDSNNNTGGWSIHPDASGSIQVLDPKHKLSCHGYPLTNGNKVIGFIYSCTELTPNAK